MTKDTGGDKSSKLKMPGAIRSRKGCIVCRRRHKKCDEQFGADGSCERCRAAGLECLLPPSQNRTKYSGETYKPTPRSCKASTLSSAAEPLQEPELSTEEPVAGPSSLQPSATPRPTLDTPLLPPPLDDLDDLPLILSSSLPVSAFAAEGCPPASSWDPFEACLDLPGPSTHHQHAGSPAYNFSDWPPRAPASSVDIARSMDLYAALGSLSPIRFTAASTRRATDALTHMYVSPDTGLIQDCYAIIHSTWLNNAKAAAGFGQRSIRTGTSKLARDLVVKVFEELVPSADIVRPDLIDASHLYDQAVQRLVACDDMPLEDRLHIISDLQLYNFAASGARQSYEAVALADKYLHALGSQAQLAAFLRASMTDPTKASMRMFVGMDLSRAISIPSARPLLPRLELYPTEAENQAAHAVVFPYEIAVVLSHVCHLPGGLSLAERQTETASLELDLLLIDEATASRPWTVRIWKLAARALLYQRVRRVGTLHPVLRSISSDLQREFGRYSPLSSSIEKALALPLFLAGTLALTQPERDAVQAHWVTLRPERGWQEPIALLRRIWAEVDETGDPVRWDDVVVREGWSIAFF